MLTLLQARYRYARVTFRLFGDPENVEVIVGVQIPTSVPSISAFYRVVRRCLQGTADLLLTSGAPDDTIASGIEARIREDEELWEPGRSYFVEVGRGNRDEYVQVFEPHGHNNHA